MNSRRSSGMLACISMRTTSPIRRRFSASLELADEVLGLLLDLHVAVADDAEQAAAEQLAAGKQPLEEQAAGSSRAAMNLRAAAPLGLARAAAPRTVDAARASAPARRRSCCPTFRCSFSARQKPRFGDERERVGRDRSPAASAPGTDGSGRSARQPSRSAPVTSRASSRRRPSDGELPAQLAARCAAGRAMSSARLGVGAQQLFGRGEAVLAQRAHTLAHLGLQARDAHHVELVEVVGRDRQEAQPLQQRVARVHRLLQHAPVERQPGELAVEEAGGEFASAAPGFAWRALGRARAATTARVDRAPEPAAA